MGLPSLAASEPDAEPLTAAALAEAYWGQRSAVAADLGKLEALAAAVGWPNDLEPFQWAQWYATTLAFQPDLILELGRLHGNSTALFCQALHRLGHGAVVSLCDSDVWETVTRPRIEPIVPPEWLARLYALRANILEVDYPSLLGRARRVLVLWDAHGFEVAETVLGGILPCLAAKDHLVLIHDVSDNRYCGAPRSYGGHPLWKGQAWQARTQAWDSRINLGWMNSAVDQVIALADFCWRNDIELVSADHAYHGFFAAHPDREREMRAVLGTKWFSRLAHWACLSVAGRPGPLYFPTPG
jgi:hypothetical protein